jgi:hypothetical protein
MFIRYMLKKAFQGRGQTEKKALQIVEVEIVTTEEVEYSELCTTFTGDCGVKDSDELVGRQLDLPTSSLVGRIHD